MCVELELEFRQLQKPVLNCLSFLQEVLELAFSVLYESDEYLNFIAPDKHEVSQPAGRESCRSTSFNVVKVASLGG